MPKKVDFYLLLSLKLSGEANEEQLRLLGKLVDADPEFRFLYDQMVNSSAELPNEAQIEEAFAANTAKRILIAEDSTNVIVQKKWDKKKLISIAALFLFFLGICFFLYISYFDKADDSISHVNEIITNKGIKSHLTLPDGSKVFINASSKIDYDNFFNNGRREVTLSGEAFFEVTHDSNRPFIVHTEKADIKVLGTSFNVKSYPNEKFQASLIKGKIQVIVKSQPKNTYLLDPLQSLILTQSPNSLGQKKNRPNISVKEIEVKDNLIAETAWMDNRLVFVNASLREIAVEIERLYGTVVVFNNQIAKNYKYTGVFENMSLAEFMDILAASRKIDFKIEDNRVIIY